MRRHRRLLCFASIAGLLLGAQLALADEVSTETSPPPLPSRKFCRENPGKCEEARAKHAAFCKENPEKCREGREEREKAQEAREQEREKKRAERRAYCKENPETCKKERAERRQRDAEMKAKCEADPAACQELKKQARETRRKQRKAEATPAQEAAPKPAE